MTTPLGSTARVGGAARLVCETCGEASRSLVSCRCLRMVCGRCWEAGHREHIDPDPEEFTVEVEEVADTYKRHPLSALWGDILDEEYADMLESVRQHGFTNPDIRLYQGMVLDGWNRCEIGLELGRLDELTFHEYVGEDPAAYVISQNAHRRHLSGSQRASIVAACREWSPVGRPKSAQQPEENYDPGSYFPGDESAPAENYEPSSYFSDDNQGTSEAGDPHGENYDPGSYFSGDSETRPATAREMAADARVSTRTIQFAKVAGEAGLGEYVRSGQVSARAAANIAKAGLAEQVTSGAITILEAAGHLRANRQPTRTEKLEAERNALRLEVQEKASRIEELEEQVRFLRGEMSEYPHEREATFNRQQAIITSLRAELVTEQGHHNDLKQAHRGAVRRLRQLEGAAGERPGQYPGAEAPDGEEPSFNPFALDGDDEPMYEDVLVYDEDRTINGFHPRELLVTDDGEEVVFHGRADDGDALVVDKAGIGRGRSMPWERLSRPQEGDGHGTG